MIELFDAHAHLDEEYFQSAPVHLVKESELGRFPSEVDIPKDFNNRLDIQMRGILHVGTSLKSSLAAVQSAENSPILYAAVGIHPNAVGSALKNDWVSISQLSENKNVVAIGETGLDKYWDTVPFESQLDAFEWHLHLAEERHLPVIIHSRECDEEMLAVLTNFSKTSQISGVIHSFSSTPSVAEQYLRLGLYISFSGSITYTNRKFAALREAAQMIPDDRLLIETDAPFLTPHPYRGKISQNVPLMVVYVAQALADLRKTSLEEIGAITTKNAEKLFRKS
ncbi:MAG: TatD family hydrolase [Planctomycetaceae bacterium]|nr:TatD family hydrolase [Planctomycetaceae bacterium]